MKCDAVRLMLSMMVDGELPKTQESDVLRHLDGCEPCRGAWARRS